MELRVLHEDGFSNIKDQFGRPQVDEGDLQGLIPLIILTTLPQYLETRKQEGDTGRYFSTREEYLRHGILYPSSDDSSDEDDLGESIEVVHRENLLEGFQNGTWEYVENEKMKVVTRPAKSDKSDEIVSKLLKLDLNYEERDKGKEVDGTNPNDKEVDIEEESGNVGSEDEIEGESGHVEEFENVESENAEEKQEEKKKKQKERVYRKYTNEQRLDFFASYRQLTGISIGELAQIKGIVPRTAQRWIKEYNATNKIPSSGKRGKKALLNLSTHGEFIRSNIEKEPYITLESLSQQLKENFDVTIKTTALSLFMKKLGLSYKKSRKEPYRRNSPHFITKRFEYASRIEEEKINYNDCIFIDEAAFQLEMKPNYGWANKGEAPVIRNQAISSGSRSVIGAISKSGVVMLNLKKPVVTSKKRAKTDTGEILETSKGTTNAHFRFFITELLKVLNGYPELKGSHLVMDNASIHKDPSVERIIKSQGYVCLYLPAYSPDLNPIEYFWNQLKKRVSRIPYQKDDSLEKRIVLASHSIPLRTFEKNVQQSKRHLKRCLEKQPL